jgi:uncharacterized membrane protein YdbT with pleckstrin-like domain
MGYIEQHLAQGERVIQRAHLHWIIFVWPAIFAIYAIMGMATPTSTPGFVLSIICLAVLTGTLALLNYYTSEFALTDRRLIAKTGIISRKSVELLLSKVESIQVDQSVLGRMLGYGTITVVGTGGGRTPFRRIADPMTFRAAAQSIMDNATGHPNPANQAAAA